MGVVLVMGSRAWRFHRPRSSTRLASGHASAQNRAMAGSRCKSASRDSLCSSVSAAMPIARAAILSASLSSVRASLLFVSALRTLFFVGDNGDSGDALLHAGSGVPRVVGTTGDIGDIGDKFGDAIAAAGAAPGIRPRRRAASSAAIIRNPLPSCHRQHVPPAHPATRLHKPAANC